MSVLSLDRLLSWSDKKPYSREERSYFVLLGLLVFVGLASVLALGLGPVEISPLDLAQLLLARIGLLDGSTVDPIKQSVFEAIRVPRVLLGLLVGASLGAAGAAMQGFFRNPLADPGLIGVSAGGALAAVAVIVLGASTLAVWTTAIGAFALPIAAFLGSLGAVALIYGVALVDGRVIVATMLLAGVAANALAFSGIGYLTFLADESQLRTLTFWTLGSLGGATWERIGPAIALMSISIAGLMTLTRPLNCLLLGEADAHHLGVRVEAVKARAALFAALGVGAATAVCGIVGFVGLVTPHIIRLMTGPDHRFVLPGAALLGGGLTVIADLIARLSVQPAELPLGVVTAAIGAPFFFWLLLRDKRQMRLG